jgi:hypothetical protein
VVLGLDPLGGRAGEGRLLTILGNLGRKRGLGPGLRGHLGRDRGRRSQDDPSESAGRARRGAPGAGAFMQLSSPARSGFLEIFEAFGLQAVIGVVVNLLCERPLAVAR